jgi:hydroxymethylbilane synthase
MPFSKKSITVGARSSALSRVQVQEVQKELNCIFPDIQFAPTFIETTGDKDLNTSLRLLDKTDFFTREIDAMQRAGHFQIAIHSAKDLPDPMPEGLVVVAMTRGLSPADALVLREGESLDTLSMRAQIGTSSLRREETIKQLRADLRCVDIRGTIERRLHLLDTCEVDGVVIAEAALIRLGLTKRTRITLPGPTAPFQGRLAIVARSDDREMLELFSAVF